MKAVRLLAACMLFGSVGTHAAQIDSTFASLGGGLWSADFSVTNNGDVAPISEFTIFFSSSSFKNLSLVNFPATWDSLVVEPDLGIPSDGFLDALVLDPADALGNGQSLAGFTLQFEYLGAGAPGRLPFDIVGPDFETVSSGFTRLPGEVSSVPEPSSLWLMALGLCPLWLLRNKRQSTGSGSQPSTVTA